MNSMTIRRRIFLSLGILVLCIGALIAVAAKHYFELVRAQRQSSQSFQMLESLHDVEIVLAADRGLPYCVATGDRIYLQPTNSNPSAHSVEFQSVYRRLLRLSIDNPRQQEALAALERDWMRLQSESTEPLRRLCQQTGPPLDSAAVGRLAQTRIGLSEVVRRDITAITGVEEQLLAERQENLDALQSLTGIVLALVAVVTLVLALLTGTSLARAAAQQDQLNSEMGAEVDQRRSIERRLVDSEMRVRAILGNVPDGIMTLDSQGGIQSFNPSAESIFGCTAENVLGKNVSVLFADSPGLPANRPSDDDPVAPEMRALVGGRRELAGVRADGSRFPMDLAVTETLMGGSQLFTAIVRDISEQRRQTEVLNRFQAVLDGTLDMIVMFDPVTLLMVYVNRGAIEGLGYLRAQLLEMKFTDLVPSASEASYRLQIAPLINDEKPWLSYEATLLREDRNEMPVEIFLQLVRQSSEDAGLFVGIARDLTERRRIDTMKSEFISVVSHELRTPLTSIRGSLGLLVGGAAGGLPERARRMVQIAHHNSERLVRLINDMLDMEKIESGNVRFEMQPIAVVTLITQAIDANRGYALQFQVEFEASSIEPGLCIRGDADRLMQVMANLMSNAAKFSPPGSVIDLRASRVDGSVRIAVTDRGTGVPFDFRDRVFQPFSQADASDSRQKGGTGLGLSICKAIVERHGGTIGFDGASNGGTTFWFELPEAQSANSVPTVRTSRILICEGNVVVADLLGVILRDAGFEVDIAKSGMDARRFLLSTRYAVLTLDADASDHDAIEFVREFGTLGLNQLPPTVMVSARAATRADQVAVGHTVLDWLVRPIDEGRLLTAVRRAARGPDGRTHLLHVEDDEDVREVILALVGEDVTVTAAPTVAQAAVFLQERVYDLVVLDVTLPDGNGMEVTDHLVGLNAATPVLVYSGNEPSPELSAKVRGALVKSRTSNADLLDTIRRLIG